MAKKFNLQPWRERLRESQKKQYIAIALTILFGFGGACAADRYFIMDNNEKREAGIARYKSEIDGFKKTQAEMKRLKELNEEVTQQVAAIDKLQSRRGFVIELLDHIANNMPKTVFLKTIEYNSDRSSVVINGYAENDSSISDFIRSFQLFHKVGEGRLDSVNISKARRNNIFNVGDDTDVKDFSITFPVIQVGN